jgi:hypothetical protein
VVSSPAAQKRTVDFSEEAARALALAAGSYLEHPQDEGRMVQRIVLHLGWSPARARWFIRINREQLERAAEEPPTSD